MTDEQFQELTSTLREAIVEEIDRRIGAVIEVAEVAGAAHQKADGLARKLADVTAALVAADGALAGRVERLEQMPHPALPVGYEAAARTTGYVSKPRWPFWRRRA